MKIVHGFFKSNEMPEMHVGLSSDGLCWLGFGSKSIERMKKKWPDAVFSKDQEAIDQAGQQIIAMWQDGKTMPLDLHGSAFQCAVWDALLAIPYGKTVCYEQIANDLGKPKAARAVGGAVGANPVSLLVPCHRVLPKIGGVGNYAWGAEVKKRLLDLENAK